MAYEAGTAVLEVAPSFLNIESMLANGARRIAQGLDKELGGKLGEAFKKASKDAGRDASRAGQTMGRAFADNALKTVNSALANLPENDRVLRPLRRELEAISKIDLSKGFDERELISRIEKVQAALKRAQQDAQGINAVGRYTNAGNAAATLGSTVELVREARRRGFAAGDAFNDAYQARLKSMRTALPDVRVNAQSTPDERRAAALRQRIESAAKLRVGDTVERDNNPLNLKVGVKISAEDLRREMATMEGLLDQFVEQASQTELVFAFDKARQHAGAFYSDVQTAAERAAEAEAQAYLKAWDEARKEQARRDAQTRAEYARLFDQALERQLAEERRAREAIASAHDDAIKEQARRDRKAREALAGDYDDAIKEQFKRDLRARQDFARDWDDAIKEQFKRDLRARQDFARDYEAALAEDLKRRKRMQDEFDRDHLAALKEGQRRAAELLRGTTAGRAKEGTRAAAAAIQVGLQHNQVDKDMAAIRARIEKYGDLTIGVNADVSGFAREVEKEFAKLKAIAKDRTVEFQVRTDAAAAASELGKVLAQLGRIDGKRAEVKIDTDSANAGLSSMLSNLTLNLGRLGALIALGSSLGTALVPAAAAAASAIGAIGTAALAASAGVGVMVLGFSGIGEAVKLMGQAEDDQKKSAASFARTGNAVAAAADQVESAEMALANTRRDNAAAEIRAQRGIRDALEDQRDAVRQAGRDVQDSVERYGDARRDATRADEAAKLAQQGLADAYRDARRAIEDLNSSVRGNALDQRQAALDIAEAKEELDKTLGNARATEAEREQARITHEQRLLQMDDLKRKGAELSDEQTKRFAAGVSGSEEVIDAQRALVDANERQADAQRDLVRAERDMRDARIEAQERIRDAQEAVTDAQEAAAEQERDAAYSLFTATQSLVSAQRSLANAHDRAGIAGGAALDNLQTKLEKMTPQGRLLAEYIFGLKDAFLGLKAAADPMLEQLRIAMISLFGETSEQAKAKLSPLMDFITRVAGSIGGSFVLLAQTLQGPTFARFFEYISQSAVPTLNRMYEAFENVLVGVVNLFLAFTPLSTDVEEGFVGLTRRFREWSEGLENNQGFQNFLNYLRESGPQVAHFLGQAAQAIAKLVAAAAPVGSVVVDMFTTLFEWINKIPRKTLTALVAGIAAAAAAISIFAGATAVLSLSIPGLIAGGIALLVVALSALVGSSDTLREKFAVAWEAIRAGAAVAFGKIKEIIATLQPVFAALGEMARSYYEDKLKPAFEAAKALFSGFASGVRPFLGGLSGYMADLGRSAVWLFQEAIVPAFNGIMAVIKELFNIVKPIFSLIGTVIGTLAGIVFWLWKNVFWPVIKGIVFLLVKTLVPAVKFMWEHYFKPIFKAVGVVVQVAAAIIKVAIALIVALLKGLGAIFLWLYQKAIKPAWDAIVKYVFKPMGEWISKHIKPHWDKAIAALGKAWAGLKKLMAVPIKFVVETLLNDGLLKGYNWLADAFDIEPKNVKISPPKGGWGGFATGGAVRGPGSATSDSIPARLSNGEHVLTAREVRAAGGHQVIYALRQAILKGSAFPGYAGGGAVGGRGVGDGFGDWLRKVGRGIKDKATDAFDSAAAFVRNPLGSLKALAKALFDKVPGKDTWMVQRLLTIPKEILETLQDKVTGLFRGGGQDGATDGGVFGNSNRLGGSGGMIQILRAIFPGLNLNSGDRPGAVTVTGNRSYHSMNRAIDVPPRMDVFEWIRANYPDSRELIFTPAGRRQLRNGQPYVYDGAVKRTHYSHVHWAYEQGGLLPDTRKMPGGTMQVFHGRRTPDKVLTDTQWQSMSTLANKARESMRGGDTWNFDFKDSTLDENRFLALQARRDALNRVTRANF